MAVNYLSFKNYYQGVKKFTVSFKKERSFLGSLFQGAGIRNFMFLEAVPDALKSNLESLGKEQLIKQFYLAGGTALALQLGHWVSRDLDFFTPQSFSEKKLISILEKLGELKIDTLETETIIGLLNGVRISFFFYRYPLIFSPVLFLGVGLAGIREIGAQSSLYWPCVCG